MNTFKVIETNTVYKSEKVQVDKERISLLMAKSITRKFLVRKLPQLPDSKDVYERHYLYVTSPVW